MTRLCVCHVVFSICLFVCLYVLWGSTAEIVDVGVGMGMAGGGGPLVMVEMRGVGMWATFCNDRLSVWLLLLLTMRAEVTV